MNKIFYSIDLFLLGCEHFRELAIQKHKGDLMFYDWSLPLNDSSFNVPEHLSSRVSTDWSFWKVIYRFFNYIMKYLIH